MIECIAYNYYVKSLHDYNSFVVSQSIDNKNEADGNLFFFFSSISLSLQKNKK